MAPSHDLSHLKVYYARVLQTRDVTPQMRRITLGELDVPAFESIGPDQFVYLFFPSPDDRSTPPVDHGFTWETVRGLPEDKQPVGRYYTVRHHRPEAGEVDIDIVLHGDGPGASFVREATPGDVVSFWGPRVAYEPPAKPHHLLLLADLTGLPATAAILASLPPGQRVDAFIEVPDAAEEQPLLTQADADVRWLHRGSMPAGKSNVLIDAVCKAELPDEGVYVHGAGEYRVMRQIRRHLREEREIPSECMTLVYYWRHADHPYEQEG